MKRFSLVFSLLAAVSLLFSACAPAAGSQPAAAVMPTVESAAETAAATDVPTAMPATEVAATATTAAPTATAAPTTAAVSVMKDALGVEMKLDKPAQKIISLAPSNTEILFAVGAGAQVIAREDFSNFPEAAAALPSIGGSMSKYNLEEMAKLQPDLILASPLTPAEQIKAMQDIITKHVFVLPNPLSLDDLYANLLVVGQLTGKEAEAETLVTDLKARAQVVFDKVAGVQEKPTVFYELDATDPAKPWTAGPGTFIDLLIGLAGGQNVGAVLTGEWAQISQEELIVQNPDVILLGDALYGNITPEMVAARAGWQDLKAVKDQRVLAFNDDLVSRPGPRMIDGLEALAKAIHPDLFK